MGIIEIYFNGFPRKRVGQGQGIGGAIDTAEIDKIITIKPRSNLIEYIIRNGVQAPWLICHDRCNE